MTTRTLDLDKLHLLTGSHYPNDEQRMCVMEAVAFLAWDAAGAAARELAPTVDELRAEAHRLVDRMLAVTE